MTFIKTLLLGTVLSITAAAAKSDDCPNGWLPNTFHGTKCCPGGMVIDEDGAYCCVNDMRPYKEALTNTALLYETTTATTTANMDWTTESDINKCYATVRFTASDYSAQVSSAVSKAEATPTGTTTTTTGTKASARTSSHTSTPTSNAAMPLATADVLSGAALAAALFML